MLIPCIAPKPFTAPIHGTSFFTALILVVNFFPIWTARSGSLSSFIISKTASAAAQDTGFPPNVPPIPPMWAESTILDLPTTPLSGNPPAIDLAKVNRSGSIPNCSIENKDPVLPNPVCTSSATITIS